MKNGKRMLVLSLIGLSAAGVGILCFGPIGLLFGLLSVGICQTTIEMFHVQPKKDAEVEPELAPNFNEQEKDNEIVKKMESEKQIADALRKDPIRTNVCDIKQLNNDNGDELTR